MQLAQALEEHIEMWIQTIHQGVAQSRAVGDLKIELL